MLRTVREPSQVTKKAGTTIPTQSSLAASTTTCTTNARKEKPSPSPHLDYIHATKGRQIDLYIWSSGSRREHQWWNSRRVADRGQVQGWGLMISSITEGAITEGAIKEGARAMGNKARGRWGCKGFGLKGGRWQTRVKRPVERITNVSLTTKVKRPIWCDKIFQERWYHKYKYTSKIAHIQITEAR
jgi:hypothetical protein